nr:uncharacterized protein LOC117276366 isoform X3 [Nicotiana tomentosiformis]
MYILFCSLLTIVLLDFIFHHGGEWVKKPLVAYSRKFVHTKQDIQTEDDFHLSAPQPSQNSQVSESSNFVFMPTPTVQRQLPTSNECPDFEIPKFEPEPDIAIRPKSISEARIRLQLRQQSVPVATRQIEFVGDSSGVSQPSKLTFSAKGITWLENSAITGNQLNKQRLTKLQARKGSGKEQK